MTTTCILRLLTVCAVGYALWAAWYLFRESRRSNRRLPVSDAAPRRREIIGKSRFVLDRRRSLPQAAVAAKTEKGIEKEPIFAPASAPEHPRQIPPEDLDEVFGEVPAGEQNEPLDIYYPLYEESFPDTEAEESDDEDETEELPLLGALARARGQFRANGRSLPPRGARSTYYRLSEGRDGTSPSGLERDRHVRGDRFRLSRRERQGKEPDRHLLLGIPSANGRRGCGKPLSARCRSRGIRRPRLCVTEKSRTT